MTFADDPPQAVDKHEYRDFKEGLAIAIQPFTNKADIEKHFGVDLLSQEVLPVFVVVENRSSSSSYIFFKDRTALVPGQLPPDGISIREALPSARTADMLGAGALAGFAGGIAFPPLTLVALSLQLMGTKMSADASEIRYNLLMRELHSRTISPGKTVSGFMYFKLPEQESPSETWFLHMNINEQRTQTWLNFKIPFRFVWRGN